MRADRLISLLLLLQSRGRLTAQALADELEVSERTIYRDMEALCAAGVPIVSELGPGGGFELPSTYRSSLTGLTETEIRTLFVAGTPQLLADLGLGGTLNAALLKLAANLPNAQRTAAAHIRQRIYIDPTGWFQALDAVPLLTIVQHAVWDDRKLQVLYQKASGEVVDRVIDPYGLVAKGGVWYLIGAVRGETRVFRISRMRAAALTGHAAERPDGFVVQAYWVAWCAWFEESRPQYRVTFRVSSAGIAMLPAALGEWVWNHVERMSATDAEGWITLSTSFGYKEEARVVLLGLGGHVEVLEPTELRDSLIATACQALTAYRARGMVTTGTEDI